MNQIVTADMDKLKPPVSTGDWRRELTPGTDEHTYFWIRQDPDHERTFRRLLSGAKKRAVDLGVDFDLTVDDLFWAFTKGRLACAMTGIEFTYSKPAGTHKAPFAPSIDRIDSARGYTRDNIRLVCVAVNYALGEWGEDTFARIARAYLRAQTAGKARARRKPFQGSVNGQLHQARGTPPPDHRGDGEPAPASGPDTSGLPLWRSGNA